MTHNRSARASHHRPDQAWGLPAGERRRRMACKFGGRATANTTGHRPVVITKTMPRPPGQSAAKPAASTASPATKRSSAIGRVMGWLAARLGRGSR